jgi:rRNA-processing protein FCF1
MKLRHGVTIESAISAINDIIQESQQPYNLTSNDTVGKLISYFNWVDTAQKRLRTVFADAELENSLLARAYWHIGALLSYQSLSRMINEEIEFQAGYPNNPADSHGRLGDAISRLRSLARLADRLGRICVLDTNVLLHYRLFDQINWPERLSVPAVRLIIPLVVVDELDEKKYARRAEFWDRARQVLGLIDRFADQAPDGYATVRDNVTVEVLPDEEGHLRALSNDQEILERCELMVQVTGQQVTLVTGDSGARINARSRGIEVLKLTDDDLLPRYKVDEGESETQTGPK